MESTDYLKLFLGLVSIVNPIGAVPVFLGLTRERPPVERRAIALHTGIAVVVILVVALLGGERVLQFFGIGLPSFRCAGGILLLLMALSMLRAEPTGIRLTAAEEVEVSPREPVAVVPLAMPLLAGPGAVSTVVVYAHDNRGWDQVGYMGAVIVGVALVTYAVLRFAPFFERLLGQTGMNVVTRVMGLMLAAIAVELMAAGAAELLRTA
ncbi:MAG TPA: MarC family protein [Candidatus Limnocylindria bacterium]|nr:MarC family protein [Candidatus Limnocylindria bacterium]